MVETGTFPHGIENEYGIICRAFTLAERTFRHTLELGNDPTINRELLDDPAYSDAAVLAKRLTVEGIERLTPEMVLDLSGDDGDTLLSAMVALDKRRAEFRETRERLSPEAGGAPEDRGGLPEHP